MAYLGFQKLEGQLAAKGIKNPGALTASIGRKKYGAATFNHAAATHTSLRKAAAKKALRK